MSGLQAFSNVEDLEMKGELLPPVLLSPVLLSGCTGGNGQLVHMVLSCGREREKFVMSYFNVELAFLLPQIVCAG